MTHDLFSRQNAYPVTPGTKRLGTSSDAAVAMRSRAPTLRERILALLSNGIELTPDEACSILGISPFAGRPRFTEMVRLNLIEETGETRRNSSGHHASVYRRK